MTGSIGVRGSARRNLYLYVLSHDSGAWPCPSLSDSTATASTPHAYRPPLTYAQNEASRQEEPKVVVQSEDSPDRILLETRIVKEDQFQKQQGKSNIVPTLCSKADNTTRHLDSMDRNSQQYRYGA